MKASIRRAQFAYPPAQWPARYVVRLHANPIVDRRLQGRDLGEPGSSLLAALAPSPGEHVLASENSRALWVADKQRRSSQRTVIGPWEPREKRRCATAYATAGSWRCCRSSSCPAGGRSPPLAAAPAAASFLLDDPNLHWPSYGHVRFRELAQDAKRHGYHVAMATVPLDAWMCTRAARCVRPAPGLAIADHPWQQPRASRLARQRSSAESLALARQALARTDSLQRRAGLQVGRIMAPPHGVCSEQMAGALLRAGFQALTVSRAYPWLERPRVNRPLAGWRPAEFVAGGLPVIERRPLRASPGELALFANLDHPLIVFGHHNDVPGGPERLRAIRDQLAALGPIRWESVPRPSCGNFMTRRAAKRSGCGCTADVSSSMSRRGSSSSRWSCPEPMPRR